MASIKQLQKRINYHFQNPEFLEQALTHRSVGAKNNERLEFLGDAILNMAVARDLYQRFPKAREGQMSRLRASMVKGKTLAEIAREFELGDYLRLGSGELKSGGFRRESILADAVEAIIGAISLDADLVVAEAKTLEWYESRLRELTLEDVRKDNKTRLQEYLQGKRLALPEYEVISITGEPHCQEFTVQCRLEDGSESIAVGSSRKLAEQKSALALLEQLGIIDD
ncbi:ribonuclease III [Salinibius halmophilus]|uniref:ribonuclease III n=1 Tax=Salinibius halmophilus TaxID=1853216 RepID=UPI000E6698C2|nr:ribonuclease III [Salinibius halmophilus]